jgi:hypothetical protein
MAKLGGRLAVEVDPLTVRYVGRTRVPYVDGGEAHLLYQYATKDDERIEVWDARRGGDSFRVPTCAPDPTTGGDEIGMKLVATIGPLPSLWRALTVGEGYVFTTLTPAVARIAAITQVDSLLTDPRTQKVAEKRYASYEACVADATRSLLDTNLPHLQIVTAGLINAFEQAALAVEVSYVDRAGKPLTKKRWDELRKDRSYCLVDASLTRPDSSIPYAVEVITEWTGVAIDGHLDALYRHGMRVTHACGPHVSGCHSGPVTKCGMDATDADALRAHARMAANARGTAATAWGRAMTRHVHAFMIARGVEHPTRDDWRAHRLFDREEKSQ